MVNRLYNGIIGNFAGPLWSDVYTDRRQFDQALQEAQNAGNDVVAIWHDDAREDLELVEELELRVEVGL